MNKYKKMEELQEEIYDIGFRLYQGIDLTFDERLNLDRKMKSKARAVKTIRK